MPKQTDVPAQYRLHADRISNAELARPACSLLVEFDAAGEPVVYTFGMGNSGMRELVGVLSDGMGALAVAVKRINAQASN